jgi:hypothetical protein
LLPSPSRVRRMVASRSCHSHIAVSSERPRPAQLDRVRVAGLAVCVGVAPAICVAACRSRSHGIRRRSAPLPPEPSRRWGRTSTP